MPTLMEKESSVGELSNSKVKFMCSYGGKILPRPDNHRLTYVGGDIKILAVDRNVTFSNIIAKVTALCESPPSSRIFLKYQLPGKDLDVLISIFNDDDVENMMYECDFLRRISTKPARLRLFVFSPPVRSGSAAFLNPDFLFGFDKEEAKSEKVETVVALPVPENLASNGSYAYQAPMFYRAPVAAGGYYNVGPYGGVVVNGVSNREQPVYNFLPVNPLAATQEQRVHIGGPVSSNHSEGLIGYDAEGGGSAHATVTMAVPSNHDNKVVPTSQSPPA